MTLRIPTITPISQGYSGVTAIPQGLVLIQWSGLLQGDTCQAIEFSDWADRSVEVSGTFGAGGTIAIQGSNVGATYYTLNDPLGNAISKTAAGLSQLLEITRYVKPLLSSGDGTTSLTISMVGRLCQAASTRSS